MSLKFQDLQAIPQPGRVLKSTQSLSDQMGLNFFTLEAHLYAEIGGCLKKFDNADFGRNTLNEIFHVLIRIIN